MRLGSTRSGTQLHVCWATSPHWQLASVPCRPKANRHARHAWRTVKRGNTVCASQPPQSDGTSRGNGSVPSLGEIGRSPSGGEQQWDELRENARNAYGEAAAGEAGRVSAEDERELRSNTSFREKGGLGTWLADTWGRLTYRYYNWRQDTLNDLQLFILLNIGLVLFGGLVKAWVVDVLDGARKDVAEGQPALWASVYQILVVVFGQELPDEAASWGEQLFALLVATGGLAAFALVLALVEQLVLQILEANVRRGSRVYERGHFVILGWCENQRDQEVMWKVLSQVCLAYRNDGGVVVVVLCDREKLEMEDQFRRLIPPEARYGTQFVFRQGSPLVPDDLRRVSASSAAATIIVSDSSRSPEEADAQSLRAAILLDELDFPGFGVPDPRTGHIVVEVKTGNAIRLIQYSCSKRVMALPTGRLNARRMARMVKHPVVGAISQMLWSFNSRSQGYLQAAGQLQGKRWDQLLYYFSDAIVFGLVNHYTKKCQINPPADTRVALGDELLLIRPTSFARGTYRATSAPATIDLGGWTPEDYKRQSQDKPTPLGQPRGSSKNVRQMLSGRFMATQELGAGHLQSTMDLSAYLRGERPGRQGGGGMFRRRSRSAPPVAPGAGLFMLPLDTLPSDEPERVLICGWGETTFMTDLLRELDHGPAALPPGSEVVLFNGRDSRTILGHARAAANLRTISLLHVQGNPLDRSDMAVKLDLPGFKCAIVLCDGSWVDPDLDFANGIQFNTHKDMLRLDSMIMMAQLNIRNILEANGFPEINLICEKVAFEGITRFEDDFRLPLGTCVNLTSFGAVIMTEVAYNPKTLLPYSHIGEKHEMAVQDIGAFCAVNEEVSFWQLQARAMMVGQILYGFYTIPQSPDQPIDIIINPEGDEFRSQKQVWNKGDGLRKVITMVPKAQPQAEGRELHREETLPRGGRVPPAAGQLPAGITPRMAAEAVERAAESVAASGSDQLGSSTLVEQ